MSMINIATNTMTISGTVFPIFKGKHHPHWIQAATGKGFDLIARVIDRLHLALRCHKCGALTKVRLFTLLTAQPLCEHCVESAWRRDAIWSCRGCVPVS